jgi:hypothetical protein
MEIIKSFHSLRYTAECFLRSKGCPAKKINSSDMYAMLEIKWKLTTVLYQVIYTKHNTGMPTYPLIQYPWFTTARKEFEN